MSILKERIKQEITEWEKLSGKIKAQRVLNNSDLSDPTIRRLIIIGGIVEDYFPKLICLTPQKSESENKIEFAPLINFFNLLGSKRNLLDRLIKRRSVKTHNNHNY